MKALILASGVGERLRPLTDETNKGMLPIGDKPVLEHIVENLARHGLKRIVMAVGVKKEQVIEHFKDGSAFGVSIEYAESDRPQQTAGEVANARQFLRSEENFIVHYGDAITNLEFSKFVNFHVESGALATGPRMKEIYTESGIYVCGDDGRVHSLCEKPFINDLIELPGIYSNVPIFCFQSRILDDSNVAFGKDISHDLIPPLIEGGKVMAFFQPDLWHVDIGNVKKYHAACEAYEKGELAKLRKLA